MNEVRLTRREQEVVNLLLTSGASDKELAKQLGIRIHTLKNHLQNIYRKYQVQGRTEMMARLMRPREQVMDIGELENTFGKRGTNRSRGAATERIEL
jgi:DNA-binding CsgD family transcriptional regulator